LGFTSKKVFLLKDERITVIYDDLDFNFINLNIHFIDNYIVLRNSIRFYLTQSLNRILNNDYSK